MSPLRASLSLEKKVQQRARPKIPRRAPSADGALSGVNRERDLEHRSRGADRRLGRDGKSRPTRTQKLSESRPLNNPTRGPITSRLAKLVKLQLKINAGLDRVGHDARLRGLLKDSSNAITRSFFITSRNSNQELHALHHRSTRLVPVHH